MPEPENPLEKILGNDDNTPVTPPVTPDDYSIATAKDDIAALAGMLALTNQQLQELTKKPDDEPTVLPQDDLDELDKNPPKSWRSVTDRSREVAREEYERIEHEKQEEQQEVAKAQEEARKVIDKEFDDALSAMEKAGELPPITNKDDVNDLGRVARRELFGYAAVLGTTNLKEINSALRREHERGYTFDVETGTFLRNRTSGLGQNVPIANSNNRGSNAPRTLSYKELHNTSLDTLADRVLNS